MLKTFLVKKAWAQFSLNRTFFHDSYQSYLLLMKNLLLVKGKWKCIKNNLKFHETILFLFVSSYVLFIFQNSFFKVGGKVVQASLYATHLHFAILVVLVMIMRYFTEEIISSLLLFCTTNIKATTPNDDEYDSFSTKKGQT